MIREERYDCQMTSEQSATEAGKGEEWTFGNGRVPWVFVEGEEGRAMGPAVVEEEDDDEVDMVMLMVPQQPRMFEQIFSFDK